jgi:hypothetical protein
MCAFLPVITSFQNREALQVKPIRCSVEETINHQKSIPSMTFHVLLLRPDTRQCETAFMCHRSQTSPRPTTPARDYENRGGGGGKHRICSNEVIGKQNKGTK